MYFGEIINRACIYLRGKHKPIYHRTKWHFGDKVIIVNAEKMTLPSDRIKRKVARYHTGHPGSLKEFKYTDLLFRKPEYLYFRSVYKQLPRNRLRFRILENLHVYQGPRPRLQPFLPSVDSSVHSDTASRQQQDPGL